VGASGVIAMPDPDRFKQGVNGGVPFAVFKSVTGKGTGENLIVVDPVGLRLKAAKLSAGAHIEQGAKARRNGTDQQQSQECCGQEIFSFHHRQRI
jgi:hypothetical protein